MNILALFPFISLYPHSFIFLLLLPLAVVFMLSVLYYEVIMCRIQLLQMFYGIKIMYMTINFYSLFSCCIFPSFSLRLQILAILNIHNNALWKTRKTECWHDWLKIKTCFIVLSCVCMCVYLRMLFQFKCELNYNQTWRMTMLIMLHS